MGSQSSSLLKISWLRISFEQRQSKMKIVFLVLALVLVTVNEALLVRDDEVDDGLHAVDDTDEVDDVDDALLAVDDTDDADEVDDGLLAVDDTDVVDDALPPVDALEDRDFKKSETTGDIVKVGKYYPKGIPLSVLFTFDTNFIKVFGANSMTTLIALVKKEFVDKSLKTQIGTTIKLTGTARKYTRAFKDIGSNDVHTKQRCQRNMGDWPCTFQMDALKKASSKTYDAYAYIGGLPKDNGGGVAMGATICKIDKGEKISFSRAPTAQDCKNDGISDCSKSYKLGVLAKTTAHEIGHNLGMEHDHDTKYYASTRKFKYRKYNGKSCKGGLMSYGKVRKGWSGCSARDFTRYLTSGGKKTPCLNYGTKKASSNGCTEDCVSYFKQCVNYAKGEGCSRAYSRCRGDLDKGQLPSDCKKKCKSTKTMLALKTNC